MQFPDKRKTGMSWKLKLYVPKKDSRTKGLIFEGDCVNQNQNIAKMLCPIKGRGAVKSRFSCLP